LNKRAIERGEIKVPKKEDWITTIRGITIQQLTTVQQAAIAAYPGATVQCKAIKSVKGNVFEATLTKFKSAKPLGCTSSDSEQDAIDKLIGYVMYIHAGYKDESNYDKFRQCHRIPASFDLYASTVLSSDPSNANHGAIYQSDVEQPNDADMMDDSSQSSYKYPGSVHPRKDEAAIEWWDAMCQNGSIDYDFGGREVDLCLLPIEYTPELYQKYQHENSPMWQKLQSPCPPRDHTTMFSVLLKNWGSDGHALRADDLTSHAGAYLKALFYSEFFDSGLSDPADCPDDNVKCHVVPYPFFYWPSNLTKDPNFTIEDLFGDESTGIADSMPMATNLNVTDLSTSSPNLTDKQSPPDQQSAAQSKPKQAGALRKSSFAPHVVAGDKPLSKIQRVLALSTTAYSGLKLNESGETFLATINIDPPKELHPVEELIYTLKVILLSGLTIDSKFALHPVYEELSSELPPLVSTEKDFPAAAREVVHYAYCSSPWQLVKVKEGQKDARGRPKRQSNIYTVIRIKSAFDKEVIMRWLLPELDMVGLRMSLKGVQMVETEITLIFWGLHPDACPEGFKSSLSLHKKLHTTLIYT
jgi:hypothetical protein